MCGCVGPICNSHVSQSWFLQPVLLTDPCATEYLRIKAGCSSSQTLPLFVTANDWSPALCVQPEFESLPVKSGALQSLFNILFYCFAFVKELFVVIINLSLTICVDWL